MAKPQRIRDPIHNLIEFDTSEFEQTLWHVVQTPPFQRLRRIKQLGFSEFVFPGATHSRFAHSIGVFHTARRLIDIIRRKISTDGAPFSDHKAKVAMAAALVHDVGHGMFSHAYEEASRALGLTNMRHERASAALIADSEISRTFKPIGSGFAQDVADLIGRKEPQDIYDSVVSSQFDADRLDYMQRDRLMTGVQSSGIDLTWLLANLEVASVKYGADEIGAGKIETFVLGPKAANTAESYILSLFHLYPNVYLHKTTRAAEVLFRLLLERVVRLALDGGIAASGLAESHPFVRFSKSPESIDSLQALDDTVFWGSLGALCDAQDKHVSYYAKSLRDRVLPACIDIRRLVEQKCALKFGPERSKNIQMVELACTKAKNLLGDHAFANALTRPRFMVDSASRTPYKNPSDSRMPVSQILVSAEGGNPTDVGAFSSIVAGASKYEILRVYVWRDDQEARDRALALIDCAVEQSK